MSERANPETKGKLLIISPWESTWALGEGAGVSDDYYFTEKVVSRGFSVHFLRPGPGGRVKEAQTGVFTHLYPNFFQATGFLPTFLKRILWPFLFNIIVVPRAIGIARKIRPDLILGHSHYTSFATFLSGKLTGAPFAVKLFGVMELSRLEWNRFRYFYKNFEQILALKIPQKAWIILDDGTRGREACTRMGIDEEKIRFLPNGVNLEWMEMKKDRKSIRKSLGISEDSVVILFLARFVSSKRPEILIGAIPKILENARHKVVFLFAGEGPLRSECEKLAGKLGVEQSTIFTGTVPHNRVPDLMAAADVFVSTSNLTNMALPTCEAFICGVPVVAFDVGETSKTVINEETGALVPDGDVNSLAEAITSLANNLKKRIEMGKKAKEFARSNFTGWDERTDMEIALISSLINTDL